MRPFPSTSLARPLFHAGHSTEDQFRELIAALGLVFDRGRFMQRCAACNALGFERLLPSDVDGSSGEGAWRGRVTAKVLSLGTVREFMGCRRCGKVYWVSVAGGL